MGNDIRGKIAGKESAGPERCVTGDGQRAGSHGAGGCGIASIRRVPNRGTGSRGAQCYANGSGVEPTGIVDSGRGNYPEIVRPNIGGAWGWQVGVFPGNIRIAGEALEGKLPGVCRRQLTD